MENEDRNRKLIERLAEFQQAVSVKDPHLAGRITMIYVPLLEYKGCLDEASVGDISSVKGDGKTGRGISEEGAEYLVRVFSGEDIQSVVEDVPVNKIRRNPVRQATLSDNGDFNGSFENVARAYED